MYLVYKPEGGEEQRLKYLPRKMMSVEREVLERRTGKNFTEFTQAVLQGNSVCRRALLWVLLKRQHHILKYEDVDFAWDELTLQYSKQELQAMREEVRKSGNDAETDQQLARLDEEIADAIDEEEEEGKARLPIAD